MTNAPRVRLALALLILSAPSVARAAESGAALSGSLASMKHQHRVALKARYTFLRSTAQVAAFVADGILEPIVGSGDFVVDAQVAHPYGRPETRLFLERLGAQYHEATGRKLVVTSLVRPTAEQPANAHRLSVHPAGMAVDLRVPANAADRKWLEAALLKLERAGVLDVTRERRPPHYHVAVFPAEYREYVERNETAARSVEASLEASAPAAAPAPSATPRVAVAPAPIAAAAAVEVPRADPRGLAATTFAALCLVGAAVVRPRSRV